MVASYRGDGLEFPSFGWFPQFNEVSCLNFFCTSSSKMYTNRYWVTKIARMRVLSFVIKNYSRSPYPQEKSIFLNITDLKQGWWKDLVRWPEVIFFRRPSITQVKELKITRRSERWQRRLKMYSRLFIVYRDYPTRILFRITIGLLAVAITLKS